VDTITPVSPAQMRALQIGFWRLGYTGADRPDRLAAASEALGLHQLLKSFSDLNAAQAEYLMGCLLRHEIPGVDAHVASRIRGREGVAVAVRAPAPDAALTARDPMATVAGWCTAMMFLIDTARRSGIGGAALALALLTTQSQSQPS
jgi:hypothetical protein